MGLSKPFQRQKSAWIRAVSNEEFSERCCQGRVISWKVHAGGFREWVQGARRCRSLDHFAHLIRNHLGSRNARQSQTLVGPTPKPLDREKRRERKKADGDASYWIP